MVTPFTPQENEVPVTGPTTGPDLHSWYAAVGAVLAKAARKDPAFARYIEGKALAFQIQTDDGIGRHQALRLQAIGQQLSLIHI